MGTAAAAVVKKRDEGEAEAAARPSTVASKAGWLVRMAAASSDTPEVLCVEARTAEASADGATEARRHPYLQRHSASPADTDVQSVGSGQQMLGSLEY
jgi:hypothetical protein